MHIIYHGYSCFEIEGKNVKITTDPYSEELGIGQPELASDIVTISHGHKNHSNAALVKDAPMILDWPGEYEKNEVFFQAIPSFHNAKDAEDLGENLVFVIHIEDVRICHLGDLGCKLTSEQLEKIGDVDILMIPVGGNRTLDAKKAVEVLEQIDPRVIIPMHYTLPGIEKELGTVQKFAETMGHDGGLEFQEKFVVQKNNLPEDKTELIVLTPPHLS